MKLKKSFRGFTIVELMVVVTIIAILVALSMPAYTRYVRKANRAEAQQLMMQYANLQEIWRANDSNYATSAEIAVPAHDRYTFHIRATGSTCDSTQAPTATQYTVVACANSLGGQSSDSEGSTPCSTLTLNQADEKTPLACW